jgi:TolB-like protein
LLGISAFISEQWEVNVSEISIKPNALSLAILPFEGLPNAQEPHLSRLSEELTVRLSNNPEIRLASDNAISALPDSSNLILSASQLGVQNIIGGTITEASEGISLSVWLYNSDKAEEVWTHNFQNAQIYVVNELIVSELLVYFDLQQDRRGLLTNNANAYDQYLRGLQNLVTNRESAEAVALFEKASLEDPMFPLPHAKLCLIQVRQYRKLRSIQAFELAERDCFRA